MNAEELMKLAAMPEYAFRLPPPPVGYWVFPGSIEGYETKFGVKAKPNWFHRMTMKWLLGFEWEDV